MLPDLLCQEWVGDELDEVVDGVNGRVDGLEALDLLPDGQGMALRLVDAAATARAAGATRGRRPRPQGTLAEPLLMLMFPSPDQNGGHGAVGGGHRRQEGKPGANQGGIAGSGVKEVAGDRSEVTPRSSRGRSFQKGSSSRAAASRIDARILLFLSFFGCCSVTRKNVRKSTKSEMKTTKKGTTP